MKSNEQKKMEPPDAYYKRLCSQETPTNSSGSSGVSAATNTESCTVDDEIQKRLLKLKQDRKLGPLPVSEDEIAQRLNKLKGELPKTSDTELQERLARLRGVPVGSVQSKVKNKLNR